MTGHLCVKRLILVATESRDVSTHRQHTAVEGRFPRGERLVATDGARNDEFSYAVALSDDGTVALVGARRDDNPRGIEAGGAYMYSRVDGAWTRQVKLLPADGDDGDIFGWSAALSGDGRTVLVGAPLDEDPEGENGGSAYVFDR